MGVDIFDGVSTMLIIFCIEVFVVIGAMAVDLASGIHKARMLGEARRSESLKRTVSKFILYVGSLCIACGIDMIFFVSQLWSLVGLGLLTKIPLISTLAAILSCAIEYKSIWEKAEDKQRRRAADTVDLLLSMVDKDTLKRSLSESAAKVGKENKGK